MSTLTPEQIAGHAAAAGFPADQLATAVAVALAESGGRTDARGDVGLQTGVWGPSIGLWQIRSLVAQRGTGAVRDELANLDPGHNARAAYALWRNDGWHPWSAYNNGAYRAHLAVAAAAVTHAAAPPPAPPAGAYEQVTLAPWTRRGTPWNSTLSGIAARFGWGADWQAVWNDPANAPLRRLRGRPELIRPGDVVHVRHR